jgi:hypothetical protein
LRQPPDPLKGEYTPSILDNLPASLVQNLGLLRNKYSSYLGFTPPLVGRGAVAFTLLTLSAILFSFKTKIAENLLSTDPLFIDSAFQPFKPSVATHWDATWFYVESKGIPDHEMILVRMLGKFPSILCLQPRLCL